MVVAIRDFVYPNKHFIKLPAEHSVAFNVNGDGGKIAMKYNWNDDIGPNNCGFGYERFNGASRSERRRLWQICEADRFSR